MFYERRDYDIKILRLTPIKDTLSHNTTDKAKATTKILKALTTTHWGKSKKTLLSTYAAIIKTTLECGSTTSPIISDKSYKPYQRQRCVSPQEVHEIQAKHLHEETSIIVI